MAETIRGGRQRSATRSLIRLAGDIPVREAGKILDRRAFRRGKKHRLNRHERTVANLSGAFAAEVVAQSFYGRHVGGHQADEDEIWLSKRTRHSPLTGGEIEHLEVNLAGLD